MTTLAELRSRLRTSLNDNAAEGCLWSDSTLDLHLGDAIRSYSRFFPLEKEAVIATVAGQAEYDLPVDCVRVVQVNVEAFGRMPLREGGDVFGEGYELYGGKLALVPAPAEGGLEVLVRYLASHSALVLDEDPSTVPAADEDLLLARGAAHAMGSLLVDEAKRERFEARYGQSAGVAADFYLRQYQAGIRERGRGVKVRQLVAG